MDVYAALADPTRREILGALRKSALSVNELAAALDINQPAMSKHLRVLREAGFLSCRTAAQQRIYQLEPAPFEEIGRWLDSYRRLWSRHLDRLEKHLDRKEKDDGQKTVRARSRSGSRGASRKR